jgi:hypothetical protein
LFVCLFVCLFVEKGMFFLENICIFCVFAVPL